MDSRYLMDMLGKYNDEDEGDESSNGTYVFGRNLTPDLERRKEEETQSMAKRHFSILTLDQAKALYQLYWLDFAAFGYQPNRFYKVTRNEP